MESKINVFSKVFWGLGGVSDVSDASSDKENETLWSRTMVSPDRDTSDSSLSTKCKDSDKIWSTGEVVSGSSASFPSSKGFLTSCFFEAKWTLRVSKSKWFPAQNSLTAFKTTYIQILVPRCRAWPCRQTSKPSTRFPRAGRLKHFIFSGDDIVTVQTNGYWQSFRILESSEMYCVKNHSRILSNPFHFGLFENQYYNLSKYLRTSWGRAVPS